MWCASLHYFLSLFAANLYAKATLFNSRARSTVLGTLAPRVLPLPRTHRRRPSCLTSWCAFLPSFPLPLPTRWCGSHWALRRFSVHDTRPGAPSRFLRTFASSSARPHRIVVCRLSPRDHAVISGAPARYADTRVRVTCEVIYPRVFTRLECGGGCAGRTYALNAPGRVDAESEKARFQSYWTTSLKMASLLTDTPKPLCECGLAGAAGREGWSVETSDFSLLPCYFCVISMRIHRHSADCLALGPNVRKARNDSVNFPIPSFLLSPFHRTLTRHFSISAG